MKQVVLNKYSITRVLEKHGIHVVSLDDNCAGGSLLPNDGREYCYIDIKLSFGSFKIYYHTESYGKVIVQILNDLKENRK